MNCQEFINLCRDTETIPYVVQQYSPSFIKDKNGATKIDNEDPFTTELCHYISADEG